MHSYSHIRKSGASRIVETESHTVEFAAMLQYENTPEVLEYFAQPLQVDHVLTGLSGKTDRLLHTPDFLFITAQGFVLEEWRQEIPCFRQIFGIFAPFSACFNT